MHINTKLQMPRTVRRSPTTRLREQLLALAEGQGSIATHEEKSWASVTFAGTRHRVSVTFAGVDAVDAGERFIAFLPEHEFTIPRQLVADAAMVSVDHTLAPEPRLTVTCELLLLDEE
ncbi:hypothetical protein [Tsuneonella sp. HG222]